MQKLWDFLFCFGVYLNPILAAAQIMVNKKRVLGQDSNLLIQGLLNQRKWMNQHVEQSLDSRAVIDCAMHCIIVLKAQKHEVLWSQILAHSSDFDAALQIKTNGDERFKKAFKAKMKTAKSGGVTKKASKVDTAKITKKDDQKEQ